MNGLPDNPFKVLRNKQGISQYTLAERVGISKHAILRLEQGCYDKPLPSVVEYWVSTYPSITRPDLMDEYADFQYAVRHSNHGLLGESLVAQLYTWKQTSPVGNLKHPLTFLREAHDLNPTQLAKMLCVPQATIVYFERNPVHQHSVPEVIIKALHDADYASEDTDALVASFDAYRKYLSDVRGMELV